MMPQFYVYLGVAVLLMSVGRVLWRRTPSKIDWELVVAFVRLDFPPDQRDIAQKIAAGLAEIVGPKIKQLRPENTLTEIVNWADEPIYTGDLIKVFNVAYEVLCEPETTFRSLVEKIADKQQQGQSSASTERDHSQG
ncbi:MAG: hypothetical protein ACM3TN_09050 [Alphaproteobacteria bacterium]